MSATSHRDLIGGLPPDTPPTLISLLQWLDAGDAPTVDNPTPSLGDLAKALHDTVSSVRRAIEKGRDSGILDGADIYNEGGKHKCVSWHTGEHDDFKGKIVGRLLFPNWNEIKQQQNFSMLRMSTLPESQYAPAEHTASVPNGAAGGEGKGAGLNTHSVTDKTSTALPPAGVVTLALREIQELFVAAQVLQGTPKRKCRTMVHSKSDDYQLRKFIARFEARSRWAPYQRVVNLFSLWIERHPRKNLKHPIAAFIAQHADWTQKLVEWEDAFDSEAKIPEGVKGKEFIRQLARTEFRTLGDDEPDAPKTKDNSSGEVKQIKSLTFECSGFSPQATVVQTAIDTFGFDVVLQAVKGWHAKKDKEFQHVKSNQEIFVEVMKGEMKDFWNLYVAEVCKNIKGKEQSK